MPPLILLSNDDGIASCFMHVVREALAPLGEVAVAAPLREQSWIGRALSRHRDVPVQPWPALGPLAWAIDGTPSDCVNIALGHLLPRRPALMVSGLNVGWNTTVPMILCSGTVAAAIEGASWGLPALAGSQHVDNAVFEALKADPAQIPPGWEETLRASAAHFATVAADLLENAPRPRGDRLLVHNLNYPRTMRPGAPVLRTHPAQIHFGSLFAATPTAPDTYRFRYHEGANAPAPGSDRHALLSGHVSHTVLDFGILGRPSSLVDGAGAS